MNQQRKYRFSLGTAVIFVVVVEIVFWIIALLTRHYIQGNVPEFRFEHPWIIYILFGLVPFLILLYLYLIAWKNSRIQQLSTPNLYPILFNERGVSTTKSILKYILLRIGLSLIVIAAANPQYGEKEREVESKGIDIMIALDVSNSMLAEDLASGYSRLRVAKLSIEKLIDKLHGDHIGIVVFAGDAFKQLPITPDYHVAKMFMGQITTGMITSQGTDVGRAIEESLTSFDFEKGTNKAIIVFTDGEDHENQAIAAAEKAQEQGVVIHTIGMGTTSGVPIPMYTNGKKSGVKKDSDGNTVLTKLNESNLIDIANAGGGSYTRANGLSIGVEGLVDQINKLEKSTLMKDKYSSYVDQFQPFLLAGLLLLLLEFFITERRSRLMNKLAWDI